MKYREIDRLIMGKKHGMSNTARVMGLGMKFGRLRRHMGFLEDMQTWADISGSQGDKWESNHAP